MKCLVFYNFVTVFCLFLINLAVHWGLNCICSMLKYTKENIFLQRVQLIQEPKFRYKNLKALCIVFLFSGTKWSIIGQDKKSSLVPFLFKFHYSFLCDTFHWKIKTLGLVLQELEFLVFYMCRIFSVTFCSVQRIAFTECQIL